MNDRFRFRAWQESTKRMFENSQLNMAVKNLKNEGGTFDVIMQCTGLRDKNGVLIFEGDVVFSESNQYYKQDEIVWDCYDMGWDIGKKDSWKLRSPMSSKTEIIGSIYENPELITGVKNG